MAKKKKISKKKRIVKKIARKSRGILLDRSSLAVVNTASKDSMRYLIREVHVLKDGTTVGTDGRIAVVIEKSSSDPDDFPELPNVGQNPVIPDGGFTVPAEVFKQVLKNVPKGKYTKAIIQHGKLTRLDLEHIEITTTDLEQCKKETARRPEGKFPDVTRIFNDVVRGIRINLDLFVLEKLVKTLVKMVKDVDYSDHKKKPIELYLSKDGKAHLVRFRVDDPEGSEDRRGLALVMPMTSEKPADLTSWEKGYLK